jgi:hypothetical protein
VQDKITPFNGSLNLPQRTKDIDVGNELKICENLRDLRMFFPEY